MKKLLIILPLLLSSSSFAQQPSVSDSVSVRQLDEVIVEANNQRLGAEVSTYIPTQKQKNAARNASDLLNRMAIPQLRVSPDDDIRDMSGQSVDIFIDYLPASKVDLEGMRMQDVKKVEYYDFPSDPRFQGKAHVLNFIMQKYVYGGYVKAYGLENTGNAGQASIYGKLKYRHTTFDIAAGAFYINQRHAGGDVFETFRLPQADGSLMTFERNSLQKSAQLRTRTYWPTLKVVYSSDRLTIQSVVGGDFNHTPASKRTGYIQYQPEMTGSTEYSENSSNRINSFSYTGSWNYIINEKNTISFSPQYAYSHTRNAMSYVENGVGSYLNSATDDSHRFNMELTYAHSFGKWGRLNAEFQTAIHSSKTHYEGTARLHDRALSIQGGPGIRYSLSIDKVYGALGLGSHLVGEDYQNHWKVSAAPWVDLSLQYAPNPRHSLRAAFHRVTSVPPAGNRSTAVIHSNQFMSYTGNPSLSASVNYDAGIKYSFIPGNSFSMSAFLSSMFADNRYVYCYEPTESGILRTIIQPGGSYSLWSYGCYASLRLFDRKLQLAAQVNGVSVQNGEPYSLRRTHLVYAFQADYYLDNWTFTGIFYAPQGYPEGSISGTWMKTRSYYMLQGGWSNSSWNLQLQIANFGRRHWRSDESIMRSRYYDRIESTYSINDHALAQFTVTYTFSFGKKVEHGDEAMQLSGAGSGILKR